jgi:hypothetical protein
LDHRRTCPQGEDLPNLNGSRRAWYNNYIIATGLHLTCQSKVDRQEKNIPSNFEKMLSGSINAAQQAQKQKQE